jgi:excisionase family DNA binding protein
MPTSSMSSSLAAVPSAVSPDAFEALWDANDVARYLKVSRSWVYQRAEAGLLPYVRVGGLLRFDPESVRAFVLHAPVGVRQSTPR